MTRMPAILTVDSREQLAYKFAGFESKHVEFEIRREALRAGDYSAKLDADDPPAETAVVERKTHSDLLGTLTHGRVRFEVELERLRDFGFAALVIEADLHTVARGSALSGANPKAIIASLVAFQQRYGLHVVFAGDRRHAEAYTWRLLERWCRDRIDARKGAAVTDQVAQGVLA